jgi:quercetin dioxygenase-like cupin family protein
VSDPPIKIYPFIDKSVDFEGDKKMSRIQALKTDALSETPSTPGITRHLAFKNEDVMVIRARINPGVASGWHHHGDYHVYGYVVSGTPRFESQDGEGSPVNLKPGDFFHVPPHTVHREINPSSEELEVILFLSGTGPLVFNLEDSDQA